jgi:hypothetical protein
LELIEEQGLLILIIISKIAIKAEEIILEDISSEEAIEDIREIPEIIKTSIGQLDIMTILKIYIKTIEREEHLNKEMRVNIYKDLSGVDLITIEVEK